MEWPDAAPIDFVLAVPLLWALWRGFQKGFIVKIVSLIALVAGVFAGFHGSDGLATWLHDELDWPESVLALTAFVLAFILVVIGVHMIGKMIEKIVDLTALGVVNKLAGMALGFIQMLCLLSIVTFALDSVFGARAWVPENAAKEAILFPHVETAIEMLIPEMRRDTPWEELRDNLQNGVDRLEDTVQSGVEQLQEK